MKDLRAALALLNDENKLNNSTFARVLVDILRDYGENFDYEELIKGLRSVSANSSGHRGEAAKYALNSLETEDLEPYTQYLYELDDSGINFVTIFDSKYPDNLWWIEDLPLAVYVDGYVESSRANVSIVGTRDATDARIEFTRKTAQSLADKGFNVVSGLASGIDAAAHEGALNSGGNTTAILPGDIQSIYPKSNAELAAEIREEGSLLSEISKFEPMHKGRYIERNRITSGISDVVVVIASGETGGTVRQAEIAKRQAKFRFLYCPDDDDGQSPQKIREMGFKQFKTLDELEDLIEESLSSSNPSMSKKMTLNDF